MPESRLHELVDLVPPADLTRGHGNENFREIGRAWVETFQLYAGLRGDESVLDVGCGPGRMALALAPILGPSGRYEGFDIRKKDIRWCKKEIEPRWPRSHFQAIDLRNKAYNRRGRRSAAELRFPYEDAAFDFVFLTSVFTHLLPDDFRNYLDEIARVLRTGGRSLITFYLINDDIRTAIGEGKSKFEFPFKIYPHCHVESEKNAEKAVAYDEAHVREQYQHVGLSIAPPVYYGSWSGLDASPPPRHGQDIILSSKK